MTEARGGELWFPKNVGVSDESFAGADDSFALWLGVRNYLVYNKIPIGDDDSAHPTGKPALEAVDYRYTGFWKGLNKKADDPVFGSATEVVDL